MQEENRPVINMGDGNNNNTISVFGMDIRKAISTAIIVGFILLSNAVMNNRYNNVLGDVHAIKLEQQGLKDQVNQIDQQYQQQAKMNIDAMNRNSHVTEKLDATVSKFNKTLESVDWKKLSK
ncbi:hypothetical protein [Aeromonas jandaei]|uniref:hypothetical protein n=1 Tax=Aeromonas jandaei TaxID=650 RepID=UPI001ADDBB8B|nr:hypothetical protein [Aeromonas jandaei]QTL93345.1 hypothetical protein AjGTCBM29_01190 [Aeromonas jandaei]